MRRHIVAVTILAVAIIFAPIGNDVSVNVGVTFNPNHKPPTKATMAQKKANKVMAMKFAKAGYGWDLRQRQCVYKLFTKESRFDHLAKNQQGSSAFGIAQMLKEKNTDPAIQILNAYRYIEHRYGTPCRAWSHHVSKNWY
jgi:hypothetical protein